MGKAFQVYLPEDMAEDFEDEQKRRADRRGKPMPANALIKLAIENLLYEPVEGGEVTGGDEAEGGDEADEETAEYLRIKAKPRTERLTAEEKQFLVDRAARIREQELAEGKRMERDPRRPLDRLGRQKPGPLKGAQRK